MPLQKPFDAAAQKRLIQALSIQLLLVLLLLLLLPLLLLLLLLLLMLKLLERYCCSRDTDQTLLRHNLTISSLLYTS